MAKQSLVRSVLTDVQFWIPLVVLIAGVLVLVTLRS